MKHRKQQNIDKLLKIMNTFTVIFQNCNDSRTVIANVDFKTAREVYVATKNHRRFFQDDLNKEEKNSGRVALLNDQKEMAVFESQCRQVRK